MKFSTQVAAIIIASAVQAQNNDINNLASSVESALGGVLPTDKIQSSLSSIGDAIKPTGTPIASKASSLASEAKSAASETLSSAGASATSILSDASSAANSKKGSATTTSQSSANHLTAPSKYTYLVAGVAFAALSNCI